MSLISYNQGEYQLRVDLAKPKKNFSPLFTTPSDKPCNDILIAPLRYQYKPCWIITVPAGFETDYASIPRPLWPILSPWGQYREAAVIHDYLYRNLGTVTITHIPTHKKLPSAFSRKECDKIFNSAMEDSNVPTWKRTTIYHGVLVGGKAVWDKYAGVIDDELNQDTTVYRGK